MLRPPLALLFVLLLLLPACAVQRQQVRWNPETLLPECPACQAPVPWQAPRCRTCAHPVDWESAPLENTPRGAFALAKLAAYYGDLPLYRRCLARDDFQEVEGLYSREGASPLGDRDRVVRTTVTGYRVFPSGTDAEVDIHCDGVRSTVGAVLEDGLWKISLSASRRAALVASAKNTVATLAAILRFYRNDHDAFPPSGIRNLVAALSRKSEKGYTYYFFDYRMLGEKGDLLDPWGNPFVYVNHLEPGGDPSRARGAEGFDLYSTGPDGKDDAGERDDLGNW